MLDFNKKKVKRRVYLSSLPHTTIILKKKYKLKMYLFRVTLLNDNITLGSCFS